MFLLMRDIASDIDMEYGHSGRLRKYAGAIANPSIRACILIRLASLGNKALYVLARNLLIALHSIDIGPQLTVGSSLVLPHPTCLVLGSGVRIGDKVTIYQGTTIGVKNGGYPVIEDEVTIFPGAIIVGAITVGRGAVIGAATFVDKDVPDNTVFR